MREELALIVIGDEPVRDNIYSSVSRSVQERKRKAREVPFPSCNNNDMTISLGSSTHAEFTQEYLTVVVCINANETGLDFDRFDARINQLKATRGNQYFNIIPVVIDNHGNTQLNSNDTGLHLKATYPQLCRNAVVIDSNDLNNPEYTRHFNIILDATLATPLYNEVTKCMRLLSGLRHNLGEITGTLTPHVTLIYILMHSFNIFGKDDIRTMDALRSYFNQNKEKIKQAFDAYRDRLDTYGVLNETYIGGMFLNLFCSIAAIFATLTIVGIPFVYYGLSQNARYHNNYCKFFATNNVDANRASIAKVEDEMNRTVLSAH